MSTGKLKIATCQFAVGGSIKRNAQRICDFMRRAKRSRADIVHFSECALSGYAGFDIKTPDDLDWPLLTEQTERIMALAAKLGIWVILGSTHRLTNPNKPHNSLYLINPKGKIIKPYDKSFCTSDDLNNYTPGNRFVDFSINGVKCSLMICFELRFPELYRKLYKRGINCIFQSFYNARQKGPSVHSYIMRQTMQCRAATNYFWISLTNSNGYYSPYPSCFIEPNGRIAGQLKNNKAGLMVNTVNLKKKFYDASVGFREMAIKGKLTNGPKNLTDPRSKNTTIL